MCYAATGVAAATMLALDAVWLTLNASKHAALIKTVQGSAAQVRAVPALLVYVLIPLAVAYFAILPAKTLSEATTRGAALGTAMYGLYDLTNLATLKGWTTAMAVTDTLWGTVLCGAGAAVGFYTQSKLSKN
uniref:DUF2177 family protein n=1 Tax=viral metagenome TaxID=1070528 RepID=A0A6C0DTP1_9ZZZZ